MFLFLRRHVGRRLTTTLGLVTVLLAFFTAFRAVFLARFWDQALEASRTDLVQALFIGFKFDARVTAVLVLPFLILSLIPSLNPQRLTTAAQFAATSRARRWWSLGYALVLTALLISYLIDLGYFAYLQGRVNATALKFLANPLISAEMVWQSYPVGWALIAILLFGFAAYWFFRRLVFVPETAPLQPMTWTRSAVLTGLTLVVLALSLHGRWSQYPLRWSEAFFSGDNFVSNLGLNPVHYFFDTLSYRTKNFDRERVAEYYDHIADYLGVTERDRERLNFARPVKVTGEIRSRPNVVYIVLESMAAYKTGVLGHPLNPTPALDEVARGGWLFSNFYTPTEATARSMFCLLTGIPDLSAGGRDNTSSRNPLIVNQNTLVNAFSGYEKFYFLGGSASWGNIRGVYEYNVNGLNIFEEGRFKSPRTDVWGISDLHLMEEAHDVLSDQAKTGKPFFAIIQTAGFHRPYTIPEDRRDFKVETLDENELKASGFVSNEEYNSLRFQDYALARFMELARTSPYFDNTLFVLHGDHGLPVRQAAHVSEGHRQFILTRFHVPLVFYAPKLLGAPRVIDTVATEPDVMPTIAGITGHEAVNTTMGRNLLDPAFADKRYAFTYVFYRTPPQMGLLDKEFLLQGEPGKVTGLFRYQSGEPNKDVRREYPEKFSEMEKTLMGLYETAKYMLYNNPNLAKDHAAQR